MPMPHPSGLAIDRNKGVVHVASTRNPNQIFDLAPAKGLLQRRDMTGRRLWGRPLLPKTSRFFPGSLYLHDLALIGGQLHANAVGHNAVVRFDAQGRFEPIWWPRCIERDGRPAFDRNYLQLNSIAAGKTPEDSYFSASADRISSRRPGHLNFPVDKRGVIFSGETREAAVRGLTRPHSARLHNSDLWVDDSGYGQLTVICDWVPQPVAQLPGWTRGLCFKDGIAFVGTSRIIPRFRRYAPGLDVPTSICGVHAVDVISGKILGSIEWPKGNQIFAVDWVTTDFTTGFPFTVSRRRSSLKELELFYAFEM